MIPLRGKVALVTGAASGMGAAAAEALAERGAHVVRADLQPASGRDGIKLDVSSEAEWQEVAKMLKNAGGIDILVNAAGVSLADDTLKACTPEIWNRTIEVNLDGTFLGCKYILPLIAGRGGGSIINFGSINSMVGAGNAIAYVASKGGVRLLTKSIALHCARMRNNVRCNLVCPGYIDTPMLGEWLSIQPSEAHDRIAAACPMGRLGQPAEVAGLVAYLASEEAVSVTGGEFVVDGGFLAR